MSELSNRVAILLTGPYGPVVSLVAVMTVVGCLWVFEYILMRLHMEYVFNPTDANHRKLVTYFVCTMFLGVFVLVFALDVVYVTWLQFVLAYLLVTIPMLRHYVKRYKQCKKEQADEDHS